MEDVIELNRDIPYASYVPTNNVIYVLGTYFPCLICVYELHTLQACADDIGPEMDSAADSSKLKENSTLHFLIMYDDHKLFKTKAEHFYDTFLESHGSGIAAFDVEYDDFANMCGEGNFRRLKAIKDVVATHA
ncbi:uncharacterized protein LOC115332705 [Ixodes scapularis]|uniref:uncharacterized protein LOC115332705 n=1 Tax=Ixodes scapularis TaxID=6945 RepID=UPI001A9FD3DB|nr:uncharacterized protein LOC115332705 [Ixodes scapularis]